MIASDEPIRFDRDSLLAGIESAGLENATDGRQHAAEDIVEFLQSVQVIEITPSNRDPYLGGEINTDLFPRDEFDKRHSR